MRKEFRRQVYPVKQMLLFLFTILMITSCSKPAVAPKPVEEKPPEPPPVEKPVVEEKKPIRGLIPESVIKEAERRYGPFARNRFRAFNAKMLELQESPTRMKLEGINDFYNQVPHGEDIDIWRQHDYWATPLEFLGRDRGDCEDYVIAKYFALRDLGIESDKLYFSYVKSLRFNSEHMVLSYFETPSSIPLILDNTNYKIFPADRRNDLVPVYNFNMETFYRSGRSGENGQKEEQRKRVRSLWEQLIRKIKMNKL